jgi:hypothetical protein
MDDSGGGARLLSTVVPVALEEACARLLQLGDAFVALARSIPDPGLPTRGLEWTLGETAAHVLQTVREYDAALRGSVRPQGATDDVIALVTQRNREELGAEPERDPLRLATALIDAIGGLDGAARGAGPDGRAVFTSEYSATTTTTVAGMIVELAVHGNDIATSIRRAWSVEPAVALPGIYAAAAALPLMLDADAAGDTRLHVEVRPRGGRAFSIRVEDGRAWTDTNGTGADARLSIDPFTFLLIAYGRLKPWTPVLRGKMLVWGRKPWRALELERLFRNP